jgi:predicted metal-binding membrane protein
MVDAPAVNLASFCVAAGAPMALGLAGVEASFRLNSAGGLAGSWAVMLLAMMAPLLAAPIDFLWERSLARRRARAAGLFLLGYALVWMPFAAVALALAAAAHGVADAARLPALAVVAPVALLWQASPWKRHCLNRCHAVVPLAAFGTRADRDALRFGASHGGWCVGACWALMALPLTAAGAHLPAMALVALFLFAERLERPQTTVWRLRWPRSGAAAIVARLRSGIPKADRTHWLRMEEAR